MADCHPDQKHMGHGLCQRCYNARYHSTVRKGSIKNHGSVYPQGHTKVSVPGWGWRV
jgi:hypothetical protein